MAEYIDRAVLLLEIINGIKAGNFEEGYENFAHINDMDDIIETIKYSDTVDVIPLEKIKQAMTEIENLSGQSCMVSDGIVDDVLDILDKLIESEDKE